MSEKEISYNEELKAYEPCSECLSIAMDAAYSQGFLTEDQEFEYAIDEEFDASEEPITVGNSTTDDPFC